MAYLISGTLQDVNLDPKNAAHFLRILLDNELIRSSCPEGFDARWLDPIGRAVNAVVSLGEKGNIIRGYDILRRDMQDSLTGRLREALGEKADTVYKELGGHKGLYGYPSLLYPDPSTEFGRQTRDEYMKSLASNLVNNCGLEEQEVEIVLEVLRTHGTRHLVTWSALQGVVNLKDDQIVYDEANGVMPSRSYEADMVMKAMEEGLHQMVDPIAKKFLYQPLRDPSAPGSMPYSSPGFLLGKAAQWTAEPEYVVKFAGYLLEKASLTDTENMVTAMRSLFSAYRNQFFERQISSHLQEFNPRSRDMHVRIQYYSRQIHLRKELGTRLIDDIIGSGEFDPENLKEVMRRSVSNPGSLRKQLLDMGR